MAVKCGWMQCLGREVLKCLVPRDGVSWGGSSLMTVFNRMLGRKHPTVPVLR